MDVAESTVGTRGITTIPVAVQKGLKLEKGFCLKLKIEGKRSDRVTMNVLSNYALILLLVLVGACFISYMAVFTPIQSSSDSMTEFSFMVNGTEKYGLYYPVTFMFSIPPNLNTLNAWYRYETTALWQELPQKTTNDFFNGINVARFNYSEQIAYVSVAFNGHTTLDICISETNSCQFIGVSKYYDNRKATVVSTNDDYSGISISQWMATIDAYQRNKIVVTIGVIPAMENIGIIPTSGWFALQQQIDEGFVSISSHSYTHSADWWVASKENDFCENEARASRDAILANLNLPYGQYVHGWIAPFHSTSVTGEVLAKYNYLIDRGRPSDFTGITQWTGAVFERASCMGGNALPNATVFQQVYNEGGIFHYMAHPTVFSVEEWKLGSAWDNVLAQIGGKTDVWYVGWGELYVYTYARLFVRAS